MKRATTRKKTPCIRKLKNTLAYQNHYQGTFGFVSGLELNILLKKLILDGRTATIDFIHFLIYNKNKVEEIRYIHFIPRLIFSFKIVPRWFCFQMSLFLDDIVPSWLRSQLAKCLVGFLPRFFIPSLFRSQLVVPSLFFLKTRQSRIYIQKST